MGTREFRVVGAAAVLRALLPLTFAVTLAPASPAAAQATLEGTVDLPAVVALPVSKPRYPVAANYTVGSPDGPAAIVFLEPTGSAPATVEPATAELAQHGYQFRPGLLAIRRGSLVRFPNLDDEYHSVFSYSKTKRFDLGRYHRDETPAEILFDVPGVVKLFCEIHDHMRGTILVLETPHFAKTDAEGRYRLGGVPAGRWTVKAWIDEDTVRERTVEVRDGATVPLDFPAAPARDPS